MMEGEEWGEKQTSRLDLPQARVRAHNRRWTRHFDDSTASTATSISVLRLVHASMRIVLRSHLSGGRGINQQSTATTTANGTNELKTMAILKSVSVNWFWNFKFISIMTSAIDIGTLVLKSIVLEPFRFSTTWPYTIQEGVGCRCRYTSCKLQLIQLSIENSIISLSSSPPRPPRESTLIVGVDGERGGYSRPQKSIHHPLSLEHRGCGGSSWQTNNIL